MHETTIKRHCKIRKRYKELLGTDTVMNLYYRLADEFCMSVDRIRQIIAMRWIAGSFYGFYLKGKRGIPSP